MKIPDSLRSRWLPLMLLCSWMSAAVVAAADWTVKEADQPPPEELGASLRSRLQNRVVQLAKGDHLVWEFWFCGGIGAKEKPQTPPTALKALEETTLLGAVRLHQDQRDYRDDELPKGLYTMRFSLQPQDGNHLGTSDYLYYAVLVPHRLDPDPAGLSTYKQLVKASSQETVSDHPMILSLWPVESDQGSFPRLIEPKSGHRGLMLNLPAQVPGQSEPVPLVFSLAFEGVAVH